MDLTLPLLSKRKADYDLNAELNRFVAKHGAFNVPSSEESVEADAVTLACHMVVRNIDAIQESNPTINSEELIDTIKGEMDNLQTILRSITNTAVTRAVNKVYQNHPIDLTRQEVST